MSSEQIAVGVFRALKDFTLYIAMIFVVGMIVGRVINATSWGRDDSDGEERSGLRVHTDALTGCQYLATRGGGITPRLDTQGRHICKPTGVAS